MFWAISGHLEGEVATQIALVADLLETCLIASAVRELCGGLRTLACAVGGRGEGD